MNNQNYGGGIYADGYATVNMDKLTSGANPCEVSRNNAEVLGCELCVCL
jgi:hypothetical protein